MVATNRTPAGSCSVSCTGPYSPLGPRLATASDTWARSPGCNVVVGAWLLTTDNSATGNTGTCTDAVTAVGWVVAITLASIVSVCATVGSLSATAAAPTSAVTVMADRVVPAGTASGVESLPVKVHTNEPVVPAAKPVAALVSHVQPVPATAVSRKPAGMLADTATGPCSVDGP